MSKMSKAVAVLGVVAGLGVAAMPLSTYALTAQSEDTIIQATVKDTIALVVEANATDAAAFDAATNTLTLSDNLIVNGPVASKSVDAVVYANGTTGYTLSIAAKDGNTDMVSTTDSTTNTSKIPAATSFGNGTKGWGFRIATDAANTWRSIADSTNDNLVITKTGAPAPIADDGTKDLNMTGTGTEADPFKVATAGTAVKFNHTERQTVTFGAAADNTVTPDTYSATVIFTATTN